MTWYVGEVDGNDVVVTQDLILLSGDLKKALVEFALSGRFARDLQQAQSQGRTLYKADGKLDVVMLDDFIMQHALPDGRGLVEHFLDLHPELSLVERALLLSWLHPLEGIFAVEERQGDAVRLANLVDELSYLVYSNMGDAALAPLEIGSFVIGCLVPLGDAWLMSGALHVLPATQRDAAYQAAGNLALRRPELVYRNPAKLEQGWRLQRENRDAFIGFFGTDLIVVPGHELAERMRAFHQYELYGQRDAEGTTAADRARQEYGVDPAVPAFDLPDELSQAETIGMNYDELDGLSFLPDFGRVLEAFDRPERSALRRYRKLLLGLLRDPSTSPRLLIRLAAQDPDKASQVFQRVLKRPRFSWERDGEALLREYKAEYFERPVLPTVAVVSAAVARARMAASAAEGIHGTDD